MSRNAVLVGRTGCDVLNNVTVIVIISPTGLAVGCAVRTG